MSVNTLQNGCFTQSYDKNPLNICEVFTSIQGEGKDCGTHALFIRLSGCNLKCSFCDTKYSWTEGTQTIQEDIIKKIKEYRDKFNNNYIIWTGGEPLLQELKLYNIISQTKDFYHHLETNGIIVPEKPFMFNSISVSPKTHLSERWLVIKNAHFKFVVSEFTEELFKEVCGIEPNRVYIMPKTSYEMSETELVTIHKKLAEQCVKEGFNFSPRLQSFFKWRAGQ